MLDRDRASQTILEIQVQKGGFSHQNLRSDQK
jgi:hypothetical protein